MNIFCKLKIGTVLKWLFIGGAVFVLVGNISYGEKWDTIFWIKSLKNVIGALGTTLISAALVSVILEISTVREMVKSTFDELLNCKFPIESYNDDVLKELKDRIVNKITSNQADLTNTPYKYERNLIELLLSTYYDFHKVTYYITPNSSEGFFNIKTKIHYKMICKKNTYDNFACLKWKLFKEDEGLTIDECIDRINFKKFQINNKDINVKECIFQDGIEKNTEKKYYDYKLRIEKSMGDTKENDIIIEYEHRVPLYDTIQNFKLQKPAKRVEHTFYINNDISTNEPWLLRASGFCAFCCHPGDGKSYDVIQEIDTSITIRFNEWMLPGDGYQVIYQPKKSFNN